MKFYKNLKEAILLYGKFKASNSDNAIIRKAIYEFEKFVLTGINDYKDWYNNYKNS